MLDRRPAPHATRWAIFALMFNACVWGLSWWPFRQFQAVGLHPLWTTVLLYSLSLVVISISHLPAWREFLRTPSLWLIMLAAGCTNTAFNWGVALGDVVRVVLLFYLMPLWAVLLARVILKERLTPLACLRMALALGGAAVVLMPAGGSGFPLPSSLPDWLGVIGGFTFAFNNVMLRREAHRGAHARALAMFTGGVLVAGAAALVMAGTGRIAWPALPGYAWLIPLAGMAILFFLSNLSLQYGAGRLPANVTAIVMLTEVPAAALSAIWLGGGHLDLKTGIGGACILAAALLAALERATMAAPFKERPAMPTSAYDFKAVSIAGQPADLSTQRGKVILIVNTASACGFTPQFKGLEQLWKDYETQGLVVVGFPSNEFGGQDPGSNDEISSFCELNYGVSFPMMEKVKVNGAEAHPLWKWLKGEKPGFLGTEGIKWNFTKFLIGRDGQVLKRYAPNDAPEKMRSDIEAALKAS